MTSVKKTILGRYDVITELGRGGMGVVYKAQDTMLGRTVALKRLLAKDNKMLIERFLGEAKSIAALNHPNIIQIFDIGKDTDGLYITTEFVDGTDLERLIKVQKKLQPKIAVKLIKPICKALLYAHKMSVIHRDIKPANILLTKDGIPKIADFGLARLESMKELEVTGVIMGTRAYASPEQFCDAKHIDQRTDIYSVGAMFYEMVTGNSPQFFRDGDVPKPLLPIILKAMERDPDRRYQSLQAMIAHFNAIGKGRPAAAADSHSLPNTIAKSPMQTEESGQTEMILIPAGPFLFGETGRKVNLKAYYIDKYPVTNEQFALWKPSHTYPPNQAKHPVTRVTWIDANAYARNVGKRLLTEMEWEKAARGTDGRRFAWGSNFFKDNCNTFESRIGTTTPVDTYPEGKSAFGVMDMAGNVWEWTSTYLDQRKTARVLKGGAFNGEAKFALSFSRFAYPESGLIPTAGFRCARSAG